MASIFGILHRDAIRRLVDDRTFERGQAYAAQGRVADLTRQEQGISAVVRGATDYHVSLRVRGDALAHACTCPVGLEGQFCKHCVAVTLAWIGEVAPDELPKTGTPPTPPKPAEIDALAAAIRSASLEDVQRLLLDEAATDAELCRRLSRRLRV